jgi:GWxTD domain-containing protein
MFAWRSHENVARRRLVSSGRTIALGPDPRRMEEFIENGTVEVTPIPGLDGAAEAIRRFREALLVAPFRRGPARHLAMALAEWDRWEELARFANEWTRAVPTEPLAWASAGLAAQRTGRTKDAERAFDSTLARLAPAERERWTRLSRLTTTRDSAKFAGLSAEQRRALEQSFWGFADPVTLTPEHEVRTEFMARVAFAELRWTSEDFDRHGADTDRGDILVRYGPPPVRFTLNAGSVVSQHVWWYPAMRLGFVFDATVGYGTATMAFDLRNFAEETRQLAPARWDNVPVVATLDTVLVQAARFRAPAGDSTDLVVFAQLPVERMAKGIDVASGTVETRFLATDARGRPVADERSSEVVRFARPDAAARRTFRTRIAPGQHAVRVEAWQETAGKAARAITSIAAEPPRGAGTPALATSDLLVADRVAPRDSASAARWTDLRLVPSVGVLRVGQPFGIAWETYDLTVREGQARYEVSVELVLVEVDRSLQLRPDMSASEQATAKLGNVTARVLGGIGDIVGTTAKGDARIALKYTRARGAPAGAATMPVALDWLSLELGDAPRGRYDLTLTVRDLATGQRRTTTRSVRVVP